MKTDEEKKEEMKIEPQVTMACKYTVKCCSNNLRCDGMYRIYSEYYYVLDSCGCY